MPEMGSELSPYCDFRHEPVAATPGQPELQVDPEDNQTGEAMESDSLVNRKVLNAHVPPVELVPVSIVSSDGFLPIRSRAKRRRARFFESSDIGTAKVNNCVVNDCDTASIENSKTVDITIDDVSSATNKIVSSDAGNSNAANQSTASNIDSSSNNYISCVVNESTLEALCYDLVVSLPV